jgi:uncharacterized protein (UPF0147 family)
MILEASRRGTLAYLADRLDGVAPDDRAVIVKAMEILRSIFADETRPRAVVK